MNSITAPSRDDAINANIGLVHACANRFRGRGIEYDDLFQAGCMGLVKAYDAFDEDRGVKFSTYAVPVILGEIKRLFRDGGSVKISRSLKELSLKVTRTRERLSISLGPPMIMVFIFFTSLQRFLYKYYTIFLGFSQSLFL